jgi:hypothetical protein
MQDVRVIGVESGALLLSTDTGSEFRLPVTSSLPGQVRQANPDGTPHKRISPKDVQARIRSGATTEQVAAILDIEAEYVRRYEGPVLAERAFILDAAQRVRVTPDESGAPDTFGAAITLRLEDGDAENVRWASWKDVEEGWFVQVVYDVAEVEHDARWRFDPKTATLTAENGDAHRLSDSADEGITPRLRAVETAAESIAHEDDRSRFDSGAFRVEGSSDSATNAELVDRPVLRAPLPRIGQAPIDERAPGNETADLLEALRRRRGEREAAVFSTEGTDDEDRNDDDPRPSLGVIDIPLAGFEMPSDRDTAPQRSLSSASSPSSAPSVSDVEQRPSRTKRSRRSMPSWDEIVFGTRPDDDLA